jgi:hypothetical protein
VSGHADWIGRVILKDRLVIAQRKDHPVRGREDGWCQEGAIAVLGVKCRSAREGANEFDKVSIAQHGIR